tara:strand:+ start:32933 stop:33151 length:219 start_codon:yes stop_codon:yes gene_type:complete
MMACNQKVTSILCVGNIEYIEGISKCQTDNSDDLVQKIGNRLNGNTKNNRVIFNAFLEKPTLKNYMDEILKM